MLKTEMRNPKTTHIDKMDTLSMLNMIDWGQTMMVVLNEPDVRTEKVEQVKKKLLKLV